jgi:hypothetical protein
MAAKKQKASKAPKKALAKAPAKAPPKALKKAAPKAAKRPTPKVNPAPKRAAPSKTTKVLAPASAKRVSAPKGKPEPPPVDHGQAIGPLYLGAGHGHLARAVDKTWIDALERYRHAVDGAISYEAKRSAAARAAMSVTFARQVQTLMNNLAARVSAILAEVQNSAITDAQRDSARSGGRMLVTELKRLNDTYGSMVGPEGIAPFGDDTLTPGMLPQLDQLQRVFFNNIARWADLERALQ